MLSNRNIGEIAVLTIKSSNYILLPNNDIFEYERFCWNYRSFMS